MYLPVRCYPTTKGTGIDTQTKKHGNKQIRDGQREREGKSPVVFAV